jgi:hypothetical protein
MMTEQQFDPAQFRATLDSLKGRDATLRELVSFTELGWPYAALQPWIRKALEKRGILNPLVVAIREGKAVGMPSLPFDNLTPYGVAFLQWYRQDHDLPAQMSLFDSEE